MGGCTLTRVDLCSAQRGGCTPPRGGFHEGGPFQRGEVYPSRTFFGWFRSHVNSYLPALVGVASLVRTTSFASIRFLIARLKVSGELPQPNSSFIGLRLTSNSPLFPR